jgi:hypothetical protein
MSYDISLVDSVTGEVLEADEPHQMYGGTYALGGTKRLELNVTYNYGQIFGEKLSEEKGIRFLYGKTGAESIPVLKKTIATLKDDVSVDYWEATEGNAKVALTQLLSLAQLRPDGVWEGD